MTRNQLAAEVKAKGIATTKNPFFMSAPELIALLNTKRASRVTGSEKIAGIKELAAKGLTRTEIIAELSKRGMVTTVGYVNNIKRCHNVEIRSARPNKNA